MTTAPAFFPVTRADAGALVAIRIAAIRDSLERIGRFDPQRARDRFPASFARRDAASSKPTIRVRASTRFVRWR
ncbi:UNVERIFIED_ORG: hypothetical protein ABIC48_003370 [Burkholderia territorii]